MTDSKPNSDSLTVLCVDDDQEFVTMLKIFLERENERFDVVTATNATIGLNYLGKHSIDCVVSDYEMPHTDGLEFLRTVRKIYPELPFILFTGKGDEAVAGKAVSAGATEYLTKESGTEQYEILADRITAAVACRDAEATLRQAAEHQSTVIESITDAVYRVDDRGRFVSVNEAFADMSGYSRTELVGSDVSLIKDDATIERFENEIREMLRHSTDDATVHFEMQTADGRCIQCEDNLSLLPLADGEYNGVVGAIRDLSTLTRRTHRPQQENDRLDEFASIVSHDLRSPLSVARGRIELVREEYESEHLTDARLALKRMDTLINDLLTLARQEVTPAERESISIQQAAVAAEQMIDDEVELTFDEDLGSIEANESRLKELFENLLNNAAQHAGPNVSVRVGRLNADEGFYVADDGRGIPHDDRDQVFEQGFTTGDNGTGLGLAIVNRIADAHGWTITLTESTTGGAQFEVRTK